MPDSTRSHLGRFHRNCHGGGGGGDDGALAERLFVVGVSSAAAQPAGSSTILWAAAAAAADDDDDDDPGADIDSVIVMPSVLNPTIIRWSQGSIYHHHIVIFPGFCFGFGQVVSC